MSDRRPDACALSCDIFKYPQGRGYCTCGGVQRRSQGAPDPVEVDARAWLRHGSDVSVTDGGVEVFRSTDLGAAMKFADELRATKRGGR